MTIEKELCKLCEFKERCKGREDDHYFPESIQVCKYYVGYSEIQAIDRALDDFRNRGKRNEKKKSN